MRTTRTAFATGIWTVCLAGVLGCGSDSESKSSAETHTLEADQVQPVKLTKTEDGMWLLPPQRDGVFQIVLCRASNQPALAEKRRDADRIGDVLDLLRKTLDAKLASQLAGNRDQFPGASAFAITRSFDAELREAAAKATFGKEETCELKDALFAAYGLAEVKHAEITAALEERATSYAQDQGWDKAAFLQLLKAAVAEFGSDVAGNRHYVGDHE